VVDRGLINADQLLQALSEQHSLKLANLSESKPSPEALAIVPGVSRSGSTLTAALFVGWQRSDAARFSFLLGIPAITLAGLVELKDALKAGSVYGPLPLVVGIISAAVVSWLAIAWLLKFLQTNSTWPFVIYRLLFGALLLGLVLGNPTLEKLSG
jgi:undecaprenyl-diphosphatase